MVETTKVLHQERESSRGKLMQTYLFDKDKLLFGIPNCILFDIGRRHL